MTELVAIGDLGEVVSGSTPDTNHPEYWNGGIPWITPADLTGNQDVHFRGPLRKITEAGFKACSTRMLPAGSILFSSRAPIGHCAVTAFPLCTNQGFKSLIPNKRLDAVYGYYALRYFTPELVAQGRGATFAEINKEIFQDFRLPVPPLPEQHRLAALLEKADHLRRTRRYAQHLSDTFLQSVFLEMFGEPAANVSNYDTAVFGDTVAGTKLGLVRGAADMNDAYPCAYVRMDAIIGDGTLDLRKLKRVQATPAELKAYSLQKNDFLFNTRNSRELVGKTALFTEPGCYLFNNNIMQVKFNKQVVPEFVMGLFQTAWAKQNLETIKSGTTSVFAIYYKDLQDLPVILPPLSLQQQFAQIVQRTERLRGQQREAARQAEHLFQTLLHRAFRTHPVTPQ